MNLHIKFPRNFAAVLIFLFSFAVASNTQAETPSCLNGPVWLGSSSYGSSILSAYDNTSIDTTFYIEGTTHLGLPSTEHLILSGKEIALRLLGGYTCDFQTQDDYTEINGFLVIESGSVEVSNIILTSIPLTLNVNSSNPSGGVPIGININGISSLTVGTPDDQTVSVGDLISLTAPPFAPNGFPFDSWSGCDSTTGGNICNVTMADNRTVTADFSTPPQNVLSVNSQPSTGITIDEVIDNSAQNLHLSQTLTTNSSSLVNSGSSVVLTAPAMATVVEETGGAVDYGFTGWAGCDDTSAYECLLTMAEDKTVTANYALPPSFIYLVVPTVPYLHGTLSSHQKSYFTFHIPTVTGSGIEVSYACQIGPCNSHLFLQKGPIAPFNMATHYADALALHNDNPAQYGPYHISYEGGLDAWSFMRQSSSSETIHLNYSSSSGPTSVRSSNITGDWYLILSNEGNTSEQYLIQVHTY